MFRKSIIAVVLGVALLLLFFTLVSARGQEDVYQMDMNTPTPLPAESTPVPELPLAGAQSGTCPMMSGNSMTGSGNMSGMGMNGMAGMQGMSGMDMSGMQGMSGMNMDNMSGMQGMQNMPAGMMSMNGMSGMNNPMVTYSTPWYSNPWLMLGWVLLILVFLTILAGIVFGLQTLRRRSKAVVPAEIS
jgi:hypothetical protein